MSTPVFPVLHGIGLTMKKTPMGKTLVQDSAALGYETRLSLGTDPIWKFDLNYVLLRKNATYDEFSQIEAFFMSQAGQFGSFLLDVGAATGDTKESSVTGQVLTPDANNVAPLIRTKPGTTITEAIYEAAGVNSNPGVAPVIKKDGTPLVAGTDYTIQGPGYSASGSSYGGLVIVFTATTTGHTITADFSWYYRVRFAQDEQDFDMFHKYLWKAKSVELIGTRA